MEGLREIVGDVGVLSIEGAKAEFIEPCLMLSYSSYSHFSLRPSAYYARSHFSSSLSSSTQSNTNKRKRKKVSHYTPNIKEQRSQQRHQEIRHFILEAHAAFLALPILSSLMKSLQTCISKPDNNIAAEIPAEHKAFDFVQIAELWQAPLYQLSISTLTHEEKHGGEVEQQISLFNTMIENVHDMEMIGECTGCTFILPKKCRLLISDITSVHQLVPGSSSDGYNVILIDPPWENKSVHRKSLYPTLPNKRLFSIPIQKLAHTEGALLGLWVTNREKLREFVEEQLFPAWHVVPISSWYWLKVKLTGEMVSNLDLAHHKPYECLLLGYVHPTEVNGECSSQVLGRKKFPGLPDKHVLISVPGDHSRKPPVGLLLSRYIAGLTPVRGLELFARELNAAWTSWGNDTLCFQHAKYFIPKINL